MAAYYNEIDPHAAQWLRNLIAAGHIAAGDVDTRSILDVAPSDLRGYTQCHFFAGIGVWSHSLRRGGWPDNRQVWTGSCPCQPFSVAGMGTGFDDKRHLWPFFHHLIAQCRPAVVFGEQVASKDADTWIDLVHTDLEALGYAVGAIPFPSASVGAPHIRDRLYWVADTVQSRWATRGASTGGGQVARSRSSEWVDNGLRDGRGARRNDNPEHDRQQFDTAGNAGRVDHHHHQGLEGLGGGHKAPSGRQGAVRPIATTSESCGLDDPQSQRRGVCDTENVGAAHAPLHALADSDCGATQLKQRSAREHPGPTNGLWRDADWLYCRDGKWRAVEPGTFPLAHGAPARVGRLRAYGNAINAEAATAFIQSYLAVNTCQ